MNVAMLQGHKATVGILLLLGNRVTRSTWSKTQAKDFTSAYNQGFYHTTQGKYTVFIIFFFALQKADA